MSSRKLNVEYFISEGNVRDRRVSRVLELLRERPYLRAAALAPLVGLGTSHLHHLFKKQVGVSIGVYARKVQIQRASELLVTTYRSLKEIRNEVGISDGSNFVRYFKEWFGMTPSAYRRESRKQDRPTNSRID